MLSPAGSGAWALVASAILVASAPAQDGGSGRGWEVTSSVSTLMTYTDNVDLGPSGDRDGSLILQVSPGLSVHGEGARVKLDLDYSPQFLWYTTDNDTRVNHRLAATSALELMEQHLFLDLRAGATRVNTNPVGATAVDGLSRSGDLTQTYYWGASPYWRQRLGPYADGILRYSFDRVIYANSDRVQNPAPGNPAFAGFGSNSNSHAFEGSLQSGRHFSQFGWNLAHSQRKVDYDAEGVDDPTFRRTNGRITYPLHRELDVYAGAGYDDNDYETTRGGEDQSGTSWEAGATWRPVQATEVTAGWGHRYFGNYWTFDLTHRSRRTVWTAGYSEDITTSRDILREQQLVRQVDPFGNPVADPLAQNPLLVPIDLPSPNSGVILRKRLDAGVAIQGRRTTTSFNLYRDRRQDQSGNTDDETVYGGTVGVSHQLSRLTSGNLFGTVQYTDPAIDDASETLWFVGVGLRHQLAEDVFGTVDLRHAQNHSDLPDQDYKENRITAGVTVNF
ncbi:MAG: TIGR03016 family PEP-CTERM system-associated outer membrane protein [Gammaproteobacteria bacterium]|nr:TIGR03016 family PEP-CTERM system-associated outer membrane protein [Gammaproteobacteria bacterium]